MIPAAWERSRAVLTAALLSSAAAAPAPEPDTLYQPFKVSASPSFADADEALAAVARSGQTRQAEFCVIGFHLRNGHEKAWVLWKQGREIILWEPRRDRARADLSLARVVIDLDHDVVADSAALGTSTSLVTRAWVERLETDCKKSGENFVIAR